MPLLCGQAHSHNAKFQNQTVKGHYILLPTGQVSSRVSPLSRKYSLWISQAKAVLPLKKGKIYLQETGKEENNPEDREYCIKGEFLANKYYDNTLKHEEGVISMARADYTSYSPALTTESYNSAGSQFFIMTKENEGLDGMYAPFGKVIEGLDIVHNIEKVETKIQEKEGMTEEEKAQAEKSVPVNDVIISKVTVDTFGSDYGVPETLEVWNYYDWVYKTYGINLQQTITQ